MPTAFKLPELGENVESGLVLKVLVSQGDAITKDQPVVELETDKATLEVPSEVSGTVSQVHVKPGDKIQVGQILLTVEESGKAAPARKEPAAPKEEKKQLKTEKTVTEAPRPSPAPPAAAPAAAVREAAPPVRPEAAAPASPAVRRLARELGVDVNQVPGSGPGGHITDEDVKAHAKQIITAPAASGGAPLAAGGVVAPPLPDFSRWGTVERQPMTGIRRKTAEHMAAAWVTIPHVTQYDEADITNLEELRERFAEQAKAAGGKLTITAIALKVVAAALKVFPQFAASIDMARQELIVKKYYHIGIAVDTEHGLLVPVIRDVDRKNIVELSAELSEVSRKARERKLSLEEMSGGVFTITNLGGIGGTYFSPIVNYPEVAILGLARNRRAPVYVGEALEPRLLLPLSLSYDHRAIDGADAARFLRWVAEAFEQPFLLSMMG